MKKYFFGLGAILIGAGLMFVFTHTEVRAESEADFDFICKLKKNAMWKEREKKWSWRDRNMIQECKKGNTICYLYRSSISCFNTGLFK